MKEEMIRVIDSSKLSDREKEIFANVLDEATKNKFLFGSEEELSIDTRRKVILYGDNEVPVGFYTPRRTSYLGTNHWRSGLVFVQRSHSHKGIAFKVLKKFFAVHTPGFAWIEDTNTVSIGLFKKLGFTKDKANDYGDPDHPGHIWVKGKLSVGNESACYSW